MRVIRYAVPAVVSVFLLGAASTASADSVVGMSIPTAPAGATLLPPPDGQQAPSSSATANPDVGSCSTNGSLSFTGLPGTPKTIYFGGWVGCSSSTIAISGQSSLYYDEFTDPGAFEAVGNVCTTVANCGSYGAYYHLTRTLPWMIHILNWGYTATLNSTTRWVDGGTGPNCWGYGTRTLHCNWAWSFSVPI